MNTVISIENVSKSYQLGTINTGTFYGDLNRWWAKLRGLPDPHLKIGERDHGNRDGETLWALKDVNFQVQQGEALGIIGSNGAGKSTLLKILSRVTVPTSGEVKVKGRIASLLEVGTGFHPDLTGRENIYLNGVIMGMNKAEISRKFDEIVDFSGVEQFIDTPVKRYSSGMYVRLAFAVAAHLDPEILIVDEVLAVGDAAFQKKCLGKMGEVAHAGRTVLFVSHQLDMIRALCSRTILLNSGSILTYGGSDEVISQYLTINQPSVVSAVFSVEEDPQLSVQVARARVCDAKGRTKQIFDVFDQICLEIDYLVKKSIVGAIICIEIKHNGIVLFWSFDTDDNEKLIFDARQTGLFRSFINLPFPLLKAGHYSISIYTGIANSDRMQSLNEIMSFDVVLISKDATYLSFAEKRPGIIATLLSWKTEKLK